MPKGTNTAVSCAGPSKLPLLYPNQYSGPGMSSKTISQSLFGVRWMRNLMRLGFLAWRASGKAPGWYYQAADRWGALAAESEPLTVTLMNGCQILCDLADEVERQIYFIGAYEPDVAFLLTRMLKPGMVVVDGGANVGQHSLIAATSVLPGGSVYSFEPVPGTFSKLCRHAALNEMHNLHPERTALWMESTTVKLGLTPAAVGNAGAFSIATVDPGSFVEAPATTLDSFAKTNRIHHIDFVKLDVEGAELASLQGMRATLERDRPSMLVEICKETARRMGYDTPAIWDLLVGEFGYDAWVVGTWDESAGRLQDLRNIEQENVLFYDGRTVSIPNMPHDLKELLRWTRARAVIPKREDGD